LLSPSVAFAPEAVAVDLGDGEVRSLSGSMAWIDKLRGDGKRTLLVFAGDHLALTGSRRWARRA